MFLPGTDRQNCVLFRSNWGVFIKKIHFFVSLDVSEEILLPQCLEALPSRVTPQTSFVDCRDAFSHSGTQITETLRCI